MPSKSRSPLAAADIHEFISRYAGFADYLNDGIGILDADGRVVHANAQLCEMLGRDLADSLGKEAKTFMVDEARQRFRTLRRAVREGTAEPYESQLLSAEGNLCHVRITPTPIFNSKGDFIGSFGVFSDISELRECERTRERIVDSARSIYNGIPIPTYTWRAEDDDFVLINCNEAASRHTEGRVKGFIGSRASEMYRDRPDIIADLVKCIREQGSFKREMGYTYAGTGDKHDFNVTYVFIHPDQVLVCTEVATEFRETMVARKEIEDRFNALAEQSLVAIFVLQDNRIKFANRAAADITEFSLDEIYNWDVRKQFFSKHVHPDDRAFVMEQATRKQLGITDETVPHYSYRAITKTGTTKWVDQYSRTVSYGGRPADFIMYVDITEHKEADERLIRSERLNRAIVENSPLGVSVRSHNGNLLSANEAWREIWQFSHAEVDAMLAKESVDILTDAKIKYLGDWIPDVRRIYELGGHLHIPEAKVRNARKNAAEWVSQFFYAIKDDDGGVDKVVILTEDVTDRKNAHERLRESEERFRSLSENLPGMIYRGNTDWTIEFHSNTEEISGYTKSDFGGHKTWLSIIHPDDRERVFQQSKELNARPEPAVQEYRILAKDGSVRWLEDHKVSRFADDGTFKGVDGVVFDITERKIAEDEIRKFQTISDRANYGAAICDMEGNVLYVNECAASMHGYAASELVGKHLSIFHNEEQMKYVKAMIERGMKDGTHVVEEVWHTRRDGSVFPTLMNATVVRDDEKRPLYLSATAIDITDRMQIQVQLEDSEARFRTTLESSPDAIAVVSLDGMVTLCNQAALDLFGYNSKDEVIGKSAFDFFSPEDRERAAANMDRTLAEGFMRNIEYTMLTKTGSQFQSELSASLIKETSGQPTAFVGIIKDISERKRQEAALRESEEKFRVVAESTPIPVIIARQSDGRILYANALIGPVFGYTDDELNEINSAVFYDDPEDLRIIEKKLETGPVRNYEARGKRKDGSTFWGTISLDTIMFGGELAYLGTFYDITEQKKTMEALRESEEKFRVIAESTPIPVTICRQSDGKVLYANSLIGLTFGYTDEELEHINSACFYDNPEDLRIIENRLESGPVRNYEARGKRKDGSTFWGIGSLDAIMFEGQLAYLCAFYDITEQKKTLEAFRESEARFRELAELLPQTVFEMDPDGHLIFSNRFGFELTGYTQEDFDEGLDIRDLFIEADHEKAKDRMQRILSGERMEPTEYTLVRKDGRTCPVLTYSSRILHSGKPAGIRGIVIDITERKRFENELLRTNEELRNQRTKLENANIALHEVLANIEDQRKEVTRRIQTNMERLIRPVVESLKRKAGEELKVTISNLERTLEELTSPFIRDLETRISRLTPREVQICDMIRGGMSSGEIASALDISELTVQKFRQQIRKKLGINNKKINLATHLCSMPYKRLANN